MSVVPQAKLTPQEYLEAERKAEFKSEYLNGEVYALAGASEAHILIAGNVVREIGIIFKSRPCKVYGSDMRVKVGTTGLYTYPDVVTVCGKAEFEDVEVDTLLNPTVIIEVLSDSTEAYDRGAKFHHYQKLESLAEYVLIAQDRVRVEHFIRQPDDRWLLWTGEKLDDVLRLPTIACELPFAEIYAKVELPADR